MTPVDPRPHVFISFRNLERDRELASQVRQSLSDASYPVWWREDIGIGDKWHEALDNELKTAGCVVVLWSKEAVDSPWVKHEASQAIARNVYLPVRVDLFEIPAPFNLLQAIDHFDGPFQSSPALRQILQRVSNLIPQPLSKMEKARHLAIRHALTIASALVAALALSLLLVLGRSVSSQVDRMSELNRSVQNQAIAVQEQTKHIADQVQNMNLVRENLDRTRGLVDKSLDQVERILAPKLTLPARFGISSMDDGYLRVENVGSGTATVLSATIYFNGDTGRPMTRANLQALIPKGHEFKVVGIAQGDQLTAGKSVSIFTIPAKSYNGKEAERIAADRERKVFDDAIRVRIWYETPFGKKQAACYRWPADKCQDAT